MDINQPLIGIGFFIAAVAFFIYARKSPLLYGPKPAKALKQEDLPKAKELEIKIRLTGGLESIEDIMTLVRLYSANNRFEDADRYCRQALQITENQLGKESAELLPILHEEARILTGQRRQVEADKVKERAKKIREAQK